MKSEMYLVSRIERLTRITDRQEAIDLLEAAREACELGKFCNARSLIIRAQDEMAR